MKISTKGKYALRIVVELAEAGSDKYTSIKSISEHQGISEKYLEHIIVILHRAGVVRSIRGAGGGYKLAKSPSQYTVGMILRIIDGSLAPVTCLDNEDSQCTNCGDCVTLYVWEKIYEAVSNVVDSITIQDIINHKEDLSSNDYNI